MNEFVAVVGIAALAAGLTYLGVPAAERFDVPHRLVSGALHSRPASSRRWWRSP